MARLLGAAPGAARRAARRGRLGAILTFGAVRRTLRPRHALRPIPEITQARFEALIERLVASVDVVDPAGLLDRIAGGPGERPAVLLWFEGQGRSIREVGVPVLAARGLPSVVSVATGVPDGTALLWWLVLDELIATRDALALDWDGERRVLPIASERDKRRVFDRLSARFQPLAETERARFVADAAFRADLDPQAFPARRLLSWDDVAALAADPGVTLAAAGIDALPLASRSVTAAKAEMRDSARVLAAAIGRPVHVFAYPQGDRAGAGAREFAFASELGFALAATDRPGVVFAGHGLHLTALPRIRVDEADADPALVLGRIAGAGIAGEPGWRGLDVD